jgi:hypothetical protein
MPAGGSREDWEALINHQSSSLTEIKSLVGDMRSMLEESQAQSEQNKTTLRLAQWALLVVAVTLLASVVVPLIVK